MNSRYWVQRRMLQAGWDALSWIVAVPAALLLRYDFSVSARLILIAFLVGVGAATLHLATGAIFHFYQGRYVVGSFDEVFGIVITTIFVGGMGTLALLILPGTNFPRSTFVIASGIAAASMLGARFVWRGASQQKALHREGKRTLIYGAGDAGSQIAQLMLNDTNHSYQPIGFIDDDPKKHHLRRSGIRVLGNQNDLETICKTHFVDTVLIAIAGVSASQLLELDMRLQPLGVQVTIIPTASEIVGGSIRLGDISDVTEEDLMGRRTVKIDEKEIGNFITGKRVLITGAGGSIGSELARQISRYRPSDLFLLDRDESALHAVQLSLDGSGHLLSPSLLLVDIRDRERIEDIFKMVCPDVVFHAAALKHLTLLERFPSEAFKTNILGTANVLSAAQATKVQKFINISTDKAANPSSVLGRSKRYTEQITSWYSESDAKSTYCSVRFGNVLGSRGSVIDTFRFQISKGGPVTVTDPEVSRYFMTIREAVHLVLQAAVLGQSGTTLILEMGSPIKIVDLATHMIKRSGREIDVVYTGLRPGEKVHEELFDSNEKSVPTGHPLIRAAFVQGLELKDVASLW